ncbi:gamma-mobile-trio recombinase GmtY [Pseudomonas idahonensis]|uniref:Site-specific integrase n=1 Tax=Pseudomonas protegens TaxID=380021 RepID=A0A9Q6N994_9PSED|nr:MULTISPECIES: gamma-mobile-trio recombinase GmtY [Pseudomonas]MDC7813829.1 gamma-mobile-trio recombinase GmtY [Pseudomonas sp. BLCC-B112]PYC40119.1 site-specific integrase [Pseudomonas protegens]
MTVSLKIRTLYQNDNTGREIELPALLTPQGILISHLRFLASTRYLKKSASWRERNVFAMKLLLSYIGANEGHFTKTTELLESFATALQYGTINIETQQDPGGLYWLPRKAEDARTLLQHITAYTDWLVGESGHEKSLVNPFRKATSVEERMNWCAYYQRQSNVFLNYLHKPKDAAAENQWVRRTQTSSVPMFNRRPSKRFPESEIHNLLENGWVRRMADPDATENDRIDWKGRAITVLMHYAGLRKSEIFHLFLSDVIVDRTRKEAYVRIWHPENGRVQEEGYTNRRDYLNRRYRRKPRTEYSKTDSLHAGWKAPLLTDGSDGFVEVYFYPLDMAKVFLHYYANYLKYQRVNPQPTEDHPYAFTNTDGRPETMKNFNRQHRDAVHRIGLEHSKKLGTTEHGHRHAYGYRLCESDLSEEFIQKALHHRNIESQRIYKEPTYEDTRVERMKGEKRLAEKRREARELQSEQEHC